MDEADPGVKLRVPRQAFLQSRHADQHQAQAALVENRPDLLQAARGQAVGLVKHQEQAMTPAWSSCWQRIAKASRRATRGTRPAGTAGGGEAPPRGSCFRLG